MFCWVSFSSSSIDLATTLGMCRQADIQQINWSFASISMSSLYYDLPLCSPLVTLVEYTILREKY